MRLYDWLLDIGLYPNKSHTLGKLKIEHRFFNDFLRGYLDGDRSIIVYTDDFHAEKNPDYVIRDSILLSTLVVRSISIGLEVS